MTPHTLEDKLVVVMRMRASLSAKSRGMAMVSVKTLRNGVILQRCCARCSGVC